MTRVLVIGLGAIGARHAAHAARHGRVRLAGVVDPDPARREPFDAPGFGSLDAVDIAVDAAIVATPTQTHAAIGTACAARGWAVLVEKPIAQTLDEADALIAACARHRVPLLVGHHRRHHAVVAQLRTALASGAIGTVLGVSAIWAVRKPAGYFDADWRQGDAGSPVHMNLIHDIDILRHVMGDIVQIAALPGAPARGRAIEDTVALALRFASGALGSVLLTDAAPSPWGFEAATGENPNIATTGADPYRFVGTGGALSFPSLRLWTGAADWGERPEETRLDPVAPTVPLDAQLAHLDDIVQNGATPVCTGADGRAALAAILEIAEKGRASWKP